jgi:hypothetical protein
MAVIPKHFVADGRFNGVIVQIVNVNGKDTGSG